MIDSLGIDEDSVKSDEIKSLYNNNKSLRNKRGTTVLLYIKRYM